MVCGSVFSFDGSASIRPGERRPLETNPRPPPLLTTKCFECKQLVNFVSGLSLCRSSPPEGDARPDCFGPPSKGDAVDEAHL